MPRDNPRRQENQPRWMEQLQQEGLTPESVVRAIRDGGKALVQVAERLGPLVKANRLSTSQIRNAYGIVKKMEVSGFIEHEFTLLKPKLAYAAARAGEDGAHQLRAVLTWAIDEVGNDEARFGRFVDFFEAILAYHKAAGGK